MFNDADNQEVRTSATFHTGHTPQGHLGPTAQTEASLLRGTETILLVEDEAFVRVVTSEVLASAGYKVLTANNAAEALRMYEECSALFDLLLTDVILPGESGRMLAQRLHERNPHLAILLMSGYAAQIQTQIPTVTDSRYQDLSEQNFRNHAADFGDCLPKPFSTATLLLKVRHVLDGRKLAASKAYLRPLAVASSQ